jgi:hypothetical protein
MTAKPYDTIDQDDAGEGASPRKTWTVPALSRMAAGKAEIGGTTGVPDGTFTES